MNLMTLFNHNLNQSIDKNKESVSYVKEITFLLNVLLGKSKKMSNACIIGAGRMNDFSVPFFIQNFDSITLSDIDYKSMENKLNKLSITKKNLEKIKLKEQEYTGLEEQQFFNLFGKIDKSTNVEEIETLLNNAFRQVENYQFDNETYDLVYVCPIYTQLVYNQVLRQCAILRTKGYREEVLKFIEGYTLDEMVGVIERFNRQLMNMVNHDGYLVVLSDIFELEKGSDFERRVTHSIQNKEIVDSIYTSYQQSYGMGLGDYGLYNLDENMETIHDSWHLWPFSEKKTFLIKMKTYRNKKGGIL